MHCYAALYYLNKMEFTVLLLAFALVCVSSNKFASGLTSRRLNDKIDSLESRLEFENEQRHKDYENIMSKLNEMTTKLENIEKKPSIAYSGEDSIDKTIAVEVSDNIASRIDGTLQYLTRGIIAEKKVNEIARQTLEKLEYRVKRELSRLGSEIIETSSTSKEQFSTISQTFEKFAKRNNEQYTTISRSIDLIETTQNDKLSKMESEITGTNAHIETLSNTLNRSMKRNDEQFGNITRGIDVIVTTLNDKYEKIGNQLEDLLNKRCNIDSFSKFMVTSTESPTTTSIPDSAEKTQDPPTDITSCKDEYKNGNRHSGVYTVYNNGNKQEVYCDQTTEGGGWTVFQRRVNGDEDFYRDWESYKMGFGDLTGNFWLGNEYLSSILGNGQHELRIDLEDFNETRAYAKYSSFLIGPESDHYTIHVSGFSGTAGDALEYHNGQKFSTKDVDLDQWPYSSCSKDHKGAWWYNACHSSNLNGLYHSSSKDDNQDGLNWYEWKGSYYSLKYVEMKFRLI